MLSCGHAKAMDRVRVVKPSKSKGGRESAEDDVDRDEETHDQVKNVVKGLSQNSPS